MIEVTPTHYTVNKKYFIVSIIIQLLLCILPLESGDKVISSGLKCPILYMEDFKPLEITLSPMAKYTTGVVQNCT